MKRLALAAAIATAFVAAPSFASSASSATLGPLVVTLHDLDPMDGISSSISFASSVNGSVAIVNTYQPTPYDHPYLSVEGTNTWAPVTASAASSQTWANASLTGSSGANASGAVLTASGGASNPVSPNSYDLTFYAAEVHADLYSQGFTLSANTLVTFSAMSTVSGRTDLHTHGGDARAYTTMQAYGPGGLGLDYQGSTDSLSGYAYNSDGHMSFSDSRILQVSFSNPTAHNLSGFLLSYAEVNGSASAVTAVPEPETYAMLLAGLGLMGSLVRRKKKQG